MQKTKNDDNNRLKSDKLEEKPQNEYGKKTDKQINFTNYFINSVVIRHEKKNFRGVKTCLLKASNHTTLNRTEYCRNSFFH